MEPVVRTPLIIVSNDLMKFSFQLNSIDIYLQEILSL